MEIKFGNFLYILLGLIYRKTFQLSKRRICEGREVAVGLGWEVSLSKDVKMVTFTLEFNQLIFCFADITVIWIFGYKSIFEKL